MSDARQALTCHGILASMKSLAGALLVACSAATLFGIEDDLPAPDKGLSLEVEPPLLIQNRAPDGSLRDENPDLAKLKNDLGRADRNAASGERLYKTGIISKVEAEERALHVVRLRAKLAEARVKQAKIELDELKAKDAAGVISSDELKASQTALADATQGAERAAEERRAAETEAAARNLQRQEKLLALGSGREADVNRAQQKLAELQQPQ